MMAFSIMVLRRSLFCDWPLGGKAMSTSMSLVGTFSKEIWGMEMRDLQVVERAFWWFGDDSSECGMRVEEGSMMFLLLLLSLILLFWGAKAVRALWVHCIRSIVWSARRDVNMDGKIKIISLIADEIVSDSRGSAGGAVNGRWSTPHLLYSRVVVVC